MQFKQIETVPIDKIKPYGKNAKTHPDKQIELLAKQIADGFDQPIVVDKDYVIIKGHGRRLAAIKMGLTTVPIIIRDDLTPDQVKAARIADNKLAETDWDMELLSEELASLADDFDLLDLGFNGSELDGLIDGEWGQDNGDDDEDMIEDGAEQIDDNAIVCPHCGGVI
jgi:ParB-like chromosome segregation protein Spo0J